jgi:hypothetical protein
MTQSDPVLLPSKELVSCDPSEYTLDWDQWPTSFPPGTVPYSYYLDANDFNRYKRMEIVRKLADKKIGLCMTRLDRKLLEDLEVEIPEYLEASVCLSGLRLARAFYDGTVNTGKIKAGYPVVFDTMTGMAVTGINSTWSPAEYRILGIAMQDFDDIHYGSVTEISESYTKKNLIPIILQQPDDHETGFIFKNGLQQIAGINQSTNEMDFKTVSVQRYDFSAFVEDPMSGKRKLLPMLDENEAEIKKCVGNPFKSPIPVNAIGFATKDNFGQYVVTAINC